MKRGMIIIFLVGILLISPLVQAQTYSGLNRFTDDVKLFFSSDKVKLALEIREREVDSAIENFQNQGEDKAIKNLERAKKKLQVVQEKVSLDTSEKIKTSVDEIIDKISEEENLPDKFEEYLLEEEKTKLTAELTEKTFEYCRELAKEDFALMLQEEQCNPDTAIPGLEKELEKLKDLQLRMFVQLMLEIRSCIDDPGTCNCEANVDIEQKAKCEKMVALAIKCEYKEDEISCDELDAMRPDPGDGFARSFVPDFLMNLFAEKHEMIEYGLEHSDGVPEECWDENDKPECEKYAHLKETGLDWDEYGNYIGTERGKIRATKGIKEPMPTMQESIPQCYDEDGNFLKEKCGKIIIVWNEEGLINYLIETEIENIIEEFENKSEQNTIEINKSGENLEQTKVWEVKEEIREINNEIRTYAAGTGPGGDAGVVIDADEPGVVTDDGGNNVIESGIDVVKEVSKTKDNEDVSPPDDDFVDVVDEDENPSEHGTVGD